MHNCLHVHLPLGLLKKRLGWLLSNRLQPEIACQGGELDNLDHNFIKSVAAQLRQEQLQVTIHAPFFDLNPGTHDPEIESITRKRFNQTLEMAESLQAKLIVFHPGYDRWRYDRQPGLWHEKSLDFWPQLIERAATINCCMTLENIFEETADTLSTLLDQLDSPWLGHCFDIGHWHLFSKISLENWFSLLGRHTRHIHLHDNRGKSDEHLPIGKGSIDFKDLFNQIALLDMLPSMTLEAHNLADLKKSLSAVKPFIADL